MYNDGSSAIIVAYIQWMSQFPRCDWGFDVIQLIQPFGLYIWLLQAQTCHTGISGNDGQTPKHGLYWCSAVRRKPTHRW